VFTTFEIGKVVSFLKAQNKFFNTVNGLLPTQHNQSATVKTLERSATIFGLL